MKKILIISPNWPPVSYPDEHRVRILLPYLRGYGWEPLILKVNPDEQEGIKDYILCKTIPAGIKVWEAGFIPKYLTRLFGISSVGLRSFFHIAKLGSKIIKEEKPDLVFFSTTMFHIMILGVIWKIKYKVPYVLDFIDPWHRGNDYPRHGSRGVKYDLADLVAKFMEPVSIKNAAHVISVSSGYNEVFLKRYKGLRRDKFSELPYGAPENDFVLLKELNIRQSVFNADDGRRHWVYTGRGGQDMHFAIEAFFIALKKALDINRELFSMVQVHFVGTNYSPRNWDKRDIEGLAYKYGVQDLVKEHPFRLTYLESLRCLFDAEALFIPGSTEAAYTASKIYPYILSRKPLLAIFHRDSSVTKILEETNAGLVISFEGKKTMQDLSEEILQNWFMKLPDKPAEINWQKFKPYLASEICRKMCGIFNKI